MFQVTFVVNGKTYNARTEEVTTTYRHSENHTRNVLKVYETDGDAERDINRYDSGMYSAPRIPDDVKVGDKAIHVRHGFGERKVDVVEVTRVTKTQIIAGDLRYMRVDGCEYGAGNDFSCTSDNLYGYNEDYMAYITANDLHVEHIIGEKDLRKELTESVKDATKTASLDQLEMTLRILQGMSPADFNEKFGG